jgi:hypothetical protein
MVLEQAGQFPAGSSFLQNGVNTGRLFDTAFTNAACATMPTGTVCEPANPTAYYTWSTGPNQWNQSLWLNRTGGAVVAFDAPQNIPYTVPSGAAYGSWAGKSILLQFNGFGNLFGVPGYCVDPSTNATVNCGPNTRYVPMFSIPDNDVSMTLPSPSTPLIVKALNAELRFADLGATPGTACAAMSISPLAVPTGGTHDPSSASDSEYLGSEPVVAGNPKVIDGIVQK